jgi:predicted RNase H-like nuclease (RuvC/YqgF family)|nr:MAG TPA: hypothetical protein [Caudoviricetes sp.]
MEWYNIISAILASVGTIGGISGFISVYHAKSKKDTIDIGNMQLMLDEARKERDEIKSEREDIRKEFDDFKSDTHKYVEDIRKKCTALEKKVNALSTKVGTLKASIYQGYRCRYPEHIEDCPVIRAYEKRHREECSLCDNEKDEDNGND